jgi:pimeloyl-ACP methyl ester carboxylesterase
VTDFLLLHGACHGGWCWDDVATRLAARGHRAVAPDLPCEDLTAGTAEYADVAVAALGSCALPADDVVVVAHSLGALTAPIVAQRVGARRMVLVAGIVGAPGRSLEQLADQDADRDGPFDVEDLETDAEHRFRFTVSGSRRLLFHDCDQAAADKAAARMRFQRSLWTSVADFDAWPDTEIVSVVCMQDRVVHPSWSQRVARERLGVEPVLVDSGHSPWLSRPAELVDVICAGL